jgi:taurine-pyruvate aminotransferase
MSLSNTPDPAARDAVVRQDLGNVLHPIVQHKVLEAKQIVVTGGEGSTVVDGDGTEYLDGMAGLWCVNIGYGRTELAEVAAEQMRQLSYFPHTAMNVPAAALAEKINGLMGSGYHTYFVNSGSEANEAGFKIARQYMKHEYPGEYRFKTISRYFAYHGTTLATLDAGGMGERKAKFEPFSGDFVHVAAAVLLSLSVRAELPELRAGLRQEHGGRDYRRGPRDCGRSHRRADHERHRRRSAAR